MPPDLYASERNLLGAARDGRVITAAEVEVLTDRLTRIRAERDRTFELLDDALDALPRFMAVVGQAENGWLPGDGLPVDGPRIETCVSVDDVREMLRRQLCAPHPDRASTSPTTRAGEATETKQKEKRPMTDRHAGYVVTLARDVREDDGEATVAAIKQIRGVIGVEPVVSDVQLGIAQNRAELAIRERVLKALYPDDTATGGEH